MFDDVTGAGFSCYLCCFYNYTLLLPSSSSFSSATSSSEITFCETTAGSSSTENSSNASSTVSTSRYVCGGGLTMGPFSLTRPQTISRICCSRHPVTSSGVRPVMGMCSSSFRYFVKASARAKASFLLVGAGSTGISAPVRALQMSRRAVPSQRSWIFWTLPGCPILSLIQLKKYSYENVKKKN